MIQTKDRSIAAVHNRVESDPRRGFASHSDFLLSVVENAGLRERADVDERLRPLAALDKDDRAAGGDLAFLLPSAFTPLSLQAAAGSDEQGGYADTFGGFAVSRSVLPTILSAVEGDPTAGRTLGVPMRTPLVSISARTDKDHSTSVTGGLTVTRHPETIEFPASRGQMEAVTLRAASLVGLAYATEEIMTDSAVSFTSMIANGFRDEFSAVGLNEKIRGGGGNEYLGVLNSPAKISVAKESGQAADTIVGQNVFKMAKRCWGFSRSIWLANQDTRLQLYGLHLPIGTAGVPIYQPSTLEERPDMLLGRPVFYTEFASTLGDEGDLILADWSQYIEGLYQPFTGAESVHVRFVNHERTLKFWLRNAGAPWWRSALTPANGSETLSPIVTLAARA